MSGWPPGCPSAARRCLWRTPRPSRGCAPCLARCGAAWGGGRGAARQRPAAVTASPHACGFRRVPRSTQHCRGSHEPDVSHLQPNPITTTPIPTTPSPTKPLPTNPSPSNPIPTNPIPTNPSPTNPIPTTPQPQPPHPPAGLPGPRPRRRHRPRRRRGRAAGRPRRGRQPRLQRRVLRRHAPHQHGAGAGGGGRFRGRPVWTGRGGGRARPPAPRRHWAQNGPAPETPPNPPGRTFAREAASNGPATPHTQSLSAGTPPSRAALPSRARPPTRPRHPHLHAPPPRRARLR